MVSFLLLVVASQLVFLCAAFLQATTIPRILKEQKNGQIIPRAHPSTIGILKDGSGSLCASPSDEFSVTNLSSSSAKPSSDSDGEDEKAYLRNRAYMENLLQNLTKQLDKWVLSGNSNKAAQDRATNVFSQIVNHSLDREVILRAKKMMERVGLDSSIGKAGMDSTMSARWDGNFSTRPDEIMRRQEAFQRQQWENSRSSYEPSNNEGRSALTRRSANNGKSEPFMGQIDDRLKAQKLADSKKDLEEALKASPNGAMLQKSSDNYETESQAAVTVSELVARAGAESGFSGEKLGIGGLDDVLAQIRRRVWMPLAVPPQLLRELGIQPVRGLLLYGKPGCGKTLLARKLGALLSPLRPVTVVSGPEVMDKFVGSSEKNLREIFDHPPDIYDAGRLGESDFGDSIARAALHVIVMDEFDAIARSRGGRGGSGDQGDAGVARDSVVNQLLAKMDGVEPPVVPTLVIGLTNKRSLIDPALLRPGRLEVHIEVPPPRTVDQRVSILKVHIQHMHNAGRLLVRDAPRGSPAANHFAEKTQLHDYDELLHHLGRECEEFSGASLAAVSRAAASHALERAVEEFSMHNQSSSLMRDCIVSAEDFLNAINDVRESLNAHDWATASTEPKAADTNEPNNLYEDGDTEDEAVA